MRRRLASVIEDLFDGKGAIGDAAGQCLSLTMFEDEVIDTAVTSNVVERADMRMIESGDCLRLASSAAESNIASKLGGQNLDRNAAAEARVAGRVDLAHPAGAEGARISYGPRRVPFCSVTRESKNTLSN